MTMSCAQQAPSEHIRTVVIALERSMCAMVLRIASITLMNPIVTTAQADSSSALMERPQPVNHALTKITGKCV